jgi:hypothetical protein
MDDRQSGPDVLDVRATGPALHRRFVTIIVAVLIVPLAVVATLTLAASARSSAAEVASARVVDLATLEAESGIRITLVAVTADGGLVDLRFRVVDRTKAEHVMHDPAAMPALFVERTGRVLTASHPLAHKVTVLDGATYFLLYPNSGGAIQAGTFVSVVIDGLRTPLIRAQS